MSTTAVDLREPPALGGKGRRHVLARVLRRKRRLRAGVLQLLAAVVAIGLAFVVPQIPIGFDISTIHVTEMLIGMGAATVAFVGIIYSLLFLVVQFGSTTFTPRLNLFRDDPIVWRSFAFYTAVLIAAVLLWSTVRTGKTVVPLVLGNAMLLIVTFTRVIGPFMITPIVGCFLVFVLSANPAVGRRRSWVVAWAAIAAIAPFVLEWTHLFARTYRLEEGYVASSSDVLYLHDNVITHGILVATEVVFFVTTAMMVAWLQYRRRQAQRSVYIQAWHLRQLLPARKPAA